jgi:hypothetical protein
VFALPKNDTERTVPLPEWTAHSIRVHIARFKPRPCSLPWEKVNGKLRTHNLLFRWTDGEFIKSRSYSETLWKPALVTATRPRMAAAGGRTSPPARKGRTSSGTTTRA